MLKSILRSFNMIVSAEQIESFTYLVTHDAFKVLLKAQLLISA